MTSSTPILYCGDHDLNDAARYLAGSLKAAGLRFDYLPSNAPFTRASRKKYRAYILSDYPKRFLTAAGAERIARDVRAGAGLLMIGGWGTFTGVDGLYGTTALADALPVRCLPRDDRRQGAAAYRIAPGPDVKLFPKFDLTSAPSLAGYNKTLLKPGASAVWNVETLAFTGGNTRAKVAASDPLLALGRYGAGRVAAYCSDLAPHWSGGLVDWGAKRLELRAAPGVTAQCGSEFVRLAQELVKQVL
jgi:uncharacterized membrane protein